MSAVQSVSNLDLKPNKNISKKKQTVSNVINFQSDNSNLLSDYLTLMGKNNLSIVSFGQNGFDYQKQKSIEGIQTRPFGTDINVDVFRPSLSSYAQWKIRTEATNRIYAKNPWPNIEHINAWMVSAETDKFMSIGGLGKVAADLPNSFNKRFKNVNDKMINITPMYTDNDKKITEKNGKMYYQYAAKVVTDPKTNRKDVLTKRIEITPMGSINVPIYNPQTNTKTENVLVNVYRGYTDYSQDKVTKNPLNDGTYYYFLDTPKKRVNENGETVDNAQIFNVQDSNPSSPNNGSPYANNIYGTDEIFRMAFFSKAVYELMKDAKEGKIKNIEAPNSVILNDWHAGPLAAMIHYTANAEADTGEISKQAGKYFNEIPTIYIAHNVEHQGSTNNDAGKRTSVFATLFGGHSLDILNNAQNWNPDNPAFGPKKSQACALMNGEGFSSAMTGMSLADRVVPVSEHYAYELTESNVKANGLIDLMKARAFGEGHTLTPITNGYSKALIAPTKEHMDSVMQGTKLDFIINGKQTIDFSNIELLPFDDGNLKNKIYNKNMVMDIFKQDIERERNLISRGDYSSRKYLLHDPFNTDISDIKDFSNVPVIAYSGRVDPQKGLDSIFKDAMWEYVEHNLYTPKEKLPVFVLGGKIAQNSSYNALAYDIKDELMKKANSEKDVYKKQGYKNIANRIILINGFVRTDLVASAADLFLVPSKFEPCGLTQLEAMAKGALPIATSTGGLVNTINDDVDGFRTKEFYDIEDGWRCTNKLYGDKNYKLFNSNGEAYCEAMERALNVYYNDHSKFEEMQKTAMKNDFSWDKQDGALDKYIKLLKTGKTN